MRRNGFRVVQKELKTFYDGTRKANLDVEWEAGASGWESRSQNSCFSGRALRGRVMATIAAGQVAYRNRSFAMGAV